MEDGVMEDDPDGLGYAFVGLLERTDELAQLLECIYPTFFRDAPAHLSVERNRWY